MATSKLRGARWPIFIVLAVLLVGAAFAASTLEKSGLQEAIDTEVAKVAGFANGSFAKAIEGVDTSVVLSDNKAAEVRAKFDREILDGGTTERIRLFATDGTLIFSTDDGDKIGTRLGAADAIRAAAGGSATGLESFDRVASGSENPQSMRLLTTYAPLEVDGRVDGVVAVDQRYRPIEDGAKGPWGMIQIGALLAAIVMLEMGLFGLAKVITSKRLAARSGFAAPKTAAVKAPARDDAAAARAAEQEAKIRHALEDQLETLRGEARQQQEASVIAAREFAEQLKTAVGRAEAAEAKAAVGQPDPQAERRARDAEQRAEAVEHRAQAAEARIAELESQVAEAAAAPAPDPEVERRLREVEQRHEATEHRAMEAEARAADLEVKLTAALQEAEERPEMPDLPEDVAGMAKELQEARQRATEQQRRALEEEQRSLAAAEQLLEAQSRHDELTARVNGLTAELDEARVEAGRAEVAVARVEQEARVGARGGPGPPGAHGRRAHPVDRGPGHGAAGAHRARTARGLVRRGARRTGGAVHRAPGRGVRGDVDGPRDRGEPDADAGRAGDRDRGSHRDARADHRARATRGRGRDHGVRDRREAAGGGRARARGRAPARRGPGRGRRRPRRSHPRVRRA